MDRGLSRRSFGDSSEYSTNQARLLVRFLILVAAAMHLAAESAIGGWFRVVDAMAHRLQSSGVGKNRCNVFVSHPAIDMPRHNLVQLPCTDKAGADRLSEGRLIVIGNPGSIGGNVRAGHAAPRSFQDEAAGKIQTRQGLPVRVLRSVAVSA